MTYRKKEWVAPEISEYAAHIGKIGGRHHHGQLTHEQAVEMAKKSVAVRQKRKTQCENH